MGNSPRPALLWANSHEKKRIFLPTVLTASLWTRRPGPHPQPAPLQRVARRFAPTQVAVIGIHALETEGERNIAKVREKAAEAGIAYPIAIDNDRKNWDV